MLARGERLLGLAHLAPLQVPDLEPDLLERAAQDGERAQERSMAIALHHLVRDRLGDEVEPRERLDLEARFEMRQISDGA